MDVHVNNVDICLVNFAIGKRQQLREATSLDPVLQELKQIIHAGLPETIKELPTDLRLHWSFWDELSVESSVVCKGWKILIPAAMKQILT